MYSAIAGSLVLITSNALENADETGDEFFWDLLTSSPEPFRATPKPVTYAG